MDIYQKRSAWKLYMTIAAVVIMVVVVLYTSFLAANLHESERNRVQLLLMAQEDLAKDLDNPDRDVSLSVEIIEANKTIPIIVVSDNDEIQYNNFPEGTTEEDVRHDLEKIKRSGIEPVRYKGYGLETLVYFHRSRLSQFITYFPIIMVLLISVFMALGYFMLSSSRKAEQNRVWVGMAKETAHQLGTPISAIVAWIEHLRAISEDEPEKLEILDELTDDVGRLELIADRFSKIGSAPSLDRKDIYDELNKSKRYMQRRASRRVQFEFPDEHQAPLYVNINSHLFNWVVENLLRNALDAMEGQGLIKAEVYEDQDHIVIDISDSGKGIPASKQKMVFQPGFTTKKRGWGLGLSLAKRIIENYHKGKIFVKKSEQNVGTTFTIKLPKNNPEADTQHLSASSRITGKSPDTRQPVVSGDK